MLRLTWHSCPNTSPVPRPFLAALRPITAVRFPRLRPAGLFSRRASAHAAVFSTLPASSNPSLSSTMDPSAILGTEGDVQHSDPAAAADGGIEKVPTGDVPPVRPEEITKNVMHLQCETSAGNGICDVYVVGTAHVSKESCREVEAVINTLKPQVVFLELCAGRTAILTVQNFHVPTLGEMIDNWRNKKMNSFGIIYSWFLAKVADKLEAIPGSEFRVAFEAAREYGAKIILGDRPVQITLRRTWGKMSLWHRTKFIYHLLFQSVFIPSSDELNKMMRDISENDMLTLMVQEMSKAFPTLMETLVHERDLYMSSVLLRVAREHNSVVAVVGKGHMTGMKKHWQEPVDMESLLELPKKASGISPLKIITSASIAAAGAAIVYGIYFSSKK